MAKKTIEAKTVNPFESLANLTPVNRSAGTIVRNVVACPELDGTGNTGRSSYRKALAALLKSPEDGIIGLSIDFPRGDRILRHYYVGDESLVDKKFIEGAHEVVRNGKLEKGTRKAIKRMAQK